MLLKKSQLAWLEEKRSDFGDAFVLDKMIEEKPERAETFNRLRAEYGDTDTLDRYISQRNVWKVSSSMWDNLSPSTRKTYEQNYNVQVVQSVAEPSRPSSTQYSGLQPKPYEAPAITGKQTGVVSIRGREPAPIPSYKRQKSESLGESVVRGVTGQTGRAFSEQLRAKYRDILDQIPDPDEIEMALDNNDTEKMAEWLMGGKIPTPEQIIAKKGEKKGMQLVSRMNQIGNGKLFTPEATKFARGVPKTLFKLGKFEITEALYGPEQLFDPIEVVGNFLTLGIAGKAITKLGQNLAKNGGAEAVAWYIHEYPSAGAILRSTIIGDVATPRPVGRASQSVAAYKNFLNKTMSKQARDVLKRAIQDGVAIEDVWKTIGQQNPNAVTGTTLKNALLKEIRKQYVGDIPMLNDMVARINSLPTKEFDNIASGWKASIRRDLGNINIEEIIAETTKREAEIKVGNRVRINGERLSKEFGVPIKSSDAIVERVEDDLIYLSKNDSKVGSIPTRYVDKVEAPMPEEMGVNLEDIIAETARRDVLRKPIATADASMPYDQFAKTMREQGYADDAIRTAYSEYANRAVINNEPIHADAMKEMLDAGLEIPEGYIERNGVWRYEPQAVPEPKAEVIPQEKPVPQMEMDLTAKAPSLPVEPSKAQEHTKIAQVETIAPEGQIAMPEKPTGVEPAKTELDTDAVVAKAKEISRQRVLGNIKVDRPFYETLEEIPPPKEGYFRVFHGTRAENINNIDKEGIKFGKDVGQGEALGEVLYSIDPKEKFGEVNVILDLPKGDKKLSEPGGIYRWGSSQRRISPKEVVGYYWHRRTVSGEDVGQAYRDLKAKAISEPEVPKETPPVAGEAIKKEAWEMTKEEFLSNPPEEMPIYLTSGGEAHTGIKGKTADITGQVTEGYRVASTVTPYDVAHKRAIEQALSEGKNVPAEVLKDYPDIAKYGSAITPEGRTVSPTKVDTTPHLENLDLVDYPAKQVRVDDIAVRASDMQYKQMDDVAKGTNKNEYLDGEWSDLKGGLVQIWEPSDPAQFGLTGNQKYIVVNGHHRLDLAKRNNVKGINVQILREADGITQQQAKLIGAHTNIAQGGGSIYDNVTVLRNERTASGTDAKMVGRSSSSQKERRAYTIANDSEISLYNAFHDRTITPEQAEIIARTAPKNESEQTLGIDIVLKGKAGKGNEDLSNLIQASRLAREQGLVSGESAQMGLFGFSDEAERSMKALSDTKNELVKELTDMEKLLEAGIRGEKLKIAPKLKKKFDLTGIKFDNPIDAQKGLNDIRAEKARWESWATDPELMARIRDRMNEKGEASQISLDFTPKEREITPPAKTGIEDVEALRAMGQERMSEIKALQEEEARIANEKVQRTFQNIQEEEPKGMSIRKVKQAPTGKLPKESPITNQDIVETLATGQQSFWQRATKDLGRKLRTGMDVLKVEMDPRLKQELRDYPEAYQFYDNVRTQWNVIHSRAIQEADKRLYGIWGDLDKTQRKYFMNMVGLKSFLSRVEEGEIPRGLTEDQVRQALDEVTTMLNKSDAGKKVLERVKEYRDLTENQLRILIARKELKPEILARYDDPDYIYIHFTPDEYFKNYLTMTKKAQEAFRPYTLKAKGTTRDIVLNEQAARFSVAQVFRDNMIDDFVDKNVSDVDIFWNQPNGLSYTMPEDELQKMFGESMMPQPGSKYDINGKWYSGYQKKKGNEKYLIDAITSDKKLEETIHDLYISGYPDLSDDEVRARIAEIKKNILAVGRKNQTFLVPTPIANKMNRMANPSNSIAGLNELRQMNRYWKTAVLRWAGLPFQLGNAFGDNFNLYMFDAPALKYVFHKSPQKIINYYRNPLKYGPNYLTPFEKWAFDIAFEKDIFTSGFSAEWASILSKARPRIEAKSVGRWLFEQTPWEERFNFRRESTTRLAELLMQLERYSKTGKVHGGIFAKDIANLDPASQMAYTARNIPIDYLSTPDWYRRNIPGIIQPFATWYHRNRANYTRLLLNKWGLPSTLLKAGLPITALYLYNTRGIPGVKDTEQNGYIYDRLGFFQRRSGTIILRGIDNDNDGKPEQAWILSPQLPLDSAMQSLGFEKMLPTLHKLDKKEITGKEAIKEIATNVLPDAVHQEVRLMAPFVNVVGGIMTNKDVVTGRDIIPENLKKGMPEDQKAVYWANYVAEKVVSPYAQYIRQNTAGDRTGFRELLERGPVDFKRALGIYKVDLVANENKDLISLMSEKQAQKAYYINEWAKAFAEDNKEGRDKALNEAKKNGVVIDYDDLLRQVRSFKVAKEKMKEAMKNAKTDEERDELKRVYNQRILNESLKKAMRDQNIRRSLPTNRE